MSNHKQRLADKLNQARMIVEGAQKPEPAQALAAFGYPQESLVEGMGYQQAAEQAYLRVLKEHTESLQARLELDVALRQLHRRYMNHVRVARKAFARNQEARLWLDVRGRRKLDRIGWLRQAYDFYQQALEDQRIAQVFAGHGINLADAQTAVSDALQLVSALQHKRGQARLARRERDEAIARLEEWLHPFVVTVRLAFNRSRGLLEQLGL